MEGDGALARGREAGQRLAWRDAYTSLSLADQSSPLGGADLELLAAAAYLLGHADECRQALQRAHRAHIAAGDVRRAARCLFWVAFTLLLEGNLAVAGGWLAKAGRMLDQEPRECAELGLLLLPSVVQASIEGDYAQAEAAAARAAEIGGRFGDADLFALGVHFQGRALLKLGRVREGLALLDESMISVVTGEVWHPVAGNIYCSMIDACLEVSDLRRADEWTTALAAWWARQPDLVTFTGQCLIHRAEIMQLHGAWPEAVEETRRACERLAHAADRYTTGAALYRQAEIQRIRGDLAAAENAFREATEWGQDAQPGLALLRLAEGDTEAAAGAIRRVVTETTDRLRRAKLLPAHVEIMLATNDISSGTRGRRRAQRNRRRLRHPGPACSSRMRTRQRPACRGRSPAGAWRAAPRLGAVASCSMRHTKPPAHEYSLASPAARSATRSPPRWNWMQPAESSPSSVPRQT